MKLVSPHAFTLIEKAGKSREVAAGEEFDVADKDTAERLKQRFGAEEVGAPEKEPVKPPAQP